MLRWTLSLLTIALIASALIFTNLFNNPVFTNISRVILIGSLTVSSLIVVFAFTSKSDWSSDIDQYLRDEDNVERLRQKLDAANKRSEFWEGKFRTVKLENNRIRRFNHNLGHDLGEASNRLADVINQAAADQKRYEAEIADLRDQLHFTPKPITSVEIPV